MFPSLQGRGWGWVSARQRRCRSVLKLASLETHLRPLPCREGRVTAAAAPPPLAGAKLAVIALALAVGTFMQVLDATIANVSLPTIAGNIGVSPDESTWIITAFAVAQGISVPLTGWLMGRFGVVRVFVWSVLLFTLASFLCGIAWSLSSLVGRYSWM